LSLINIGGFLLPQEWFFGTAIGFAILIITVLYLALRGRGEGSRSENETPVERNLVALTPVDQNNVPQLGKLLENATMTDKDLLLQDPDIIDEETEEPKTIRIAYEDVVPLSVLDADKNLLRLWGVVKRKGEYVAYSFASLADVVRQRFDPLESDPYEVGRHYIGGPPRVGGMAQILQSTTGKIIIIGASVLIGLLIGYIAGGAGVHR
jgi:hypothetical protein